MQDNSIVKEELKNIYSDVSEWLKYAEVKHAGILVFWTALVVAAFSVDKFYNLTDELQIYILLAMVLGILINIFALVPFTNRIKWLKKMCYNRYKEYAGNLVFYQSIFVSVSLPNLTLDEEADRYKEILKEEFGYVPQGKIITDYIKQIIEVATVATIKTFLFSISAWYLCLFIIIAFLYILF
ncbi:MAG: hypothetical protein IKW30_09395 [Lachnospiraceae bacterium]|nr:hypothetical protein [Lachnospiraceae bacterium]